MASLPAASPAHSTRDLADSLRSSLMRIGRRLRQQTGTAELSVNDSLLLATISRRPGIGVSDLAAMERTTRATMSLHVKRLEAGGWLTRQPVAEDRRRAELALSPRAQKVMAEARRRRDDWLERQLQRLPDEARARLHAAADVLTMLAEQDG